MTAPEPRAAVYTRVSTDEQAVHGQSLADQWERGRTRALELGAADADRFEDAGESGASLERPALTALRQAVAAGAYAWVVVTDPDRLARRLVDQLLLTDEITRRAALVFVQFDWQDTPDGRLFYALRGAIAEFEREKIRQRTHMGRLRAARAGRLVAVPHQAYGYAYDRRTRRLQAVASEAAVVCAAYALCAEREWGGARIAAHLNRMGLAARHGGAWHPESVRRMLRNPLYAGRLRQMGQTLTVPALVPEERWRAAQDVLDRHRGRRPGRRRRAYLLSGLAACARCGRPLVSKASDASGRYRYYVCGGRRARRCDAPALAAAPLEAAVWRAAAAAVRPLLPALAASGAASPSPAPIDIGPERARILRLARRGILTADEAERQLGALARAAALAAEKDGDAAPGGGAPRARPSQDDRTQVRRALLRAMGAAVSVDAAGARPAVTVSLSLALPPARPAGRTRPTRGGAAP